MGGSGFCSGLDKKWGVTTVVVGYRGDWVSPVNSSVAFERHLCVLHGVGKGNSGVRGWEWLFGYGFMSLAQVLVHRDAVNVPL